MHGCKVCKDDGGLCRACGEPGKPQASVGKQVATGTWADHYTHTIPAKQQNGKHQNGATFKSCVHDAKASCLGLTWKGQVKRLYGAQGGQLMHPKVRTSHLGLIIDCAQLVKPRQVFILSAPKRYHGLADALRGPDILSLHWPDMSAPWHVGIQFWKQLLDLMPEHTACCCVGGHGRTGTALASLLVASGLEPDVAISMVREKHCNKAIETTEQSDYVKALGNSAKV